MGKGSRVSAPRWAKLRQSVDWGFYTVSASKIAIYSGQAVPKGALDFPSPPNSFLRPLCVPPERDTVQLGPQAHAYLVRPGTITATLSSIPTLRNRETIGPCIRQCMSVFLTPLIGNDHRQRLVVTIKGSKYYLNGLSGSPAR